MAENKNKEIMQFYLRLGKQGYFPLFYKEWIVNSLASELNDDSVNLATTFSKIQKRMGVHKKIETISALTTSERNSFIKLFFAEIDKEILNETYKYH